MKALRLLLVFLAGACGKSQQNTSVAIAPVSDLQIGDSLLSTYPDSAFYYYNKAVEYSEDSFYKAAGFNRMALVQHGAGDYFGSQETVLASLKLLDEKNKIHHPTISANYNLLANNCLNLENYDDAIRYFDLAIKFAGQEQNIPIFQNNKAVAYQKKREYGQAIAIYETALKKTIQDSIEYARIRSNLAKARWLQNPRYPATPEFHEALQVRKFKGDQWGLNASYAHLSDYYTDVSPDSARQYAEKMYEVAKRLNSPDDQIEALEKLIRVSPATSIKTYFTRYDELSDSLQNIRNNAKNQFALIRYETEKGKVENLRLQRDNTKQRIFMFGTAAISLMIIFLSIAAYRYRKRKIEWKSRNEIRENQLKTSKKIHDVVANGLYGIMTDLEHRDIVEKDRLLDKIENLYEQSRDISYEQPEPVAENFSLRMHNLLSSFATGSVKVLIVGNDEKTWAAISASKKKELEYVLQEVMVNMSKHSRAHNVVARFNTETDTLKIYYQDDGIGFPSNFRYGIGFPSNFRYGNGLRNTENRIKGLGGTINFDGKNGLKIEISLPIAKAND